MVAFLLFALQDPVIEGAELVTGGAFRPGHWAPLEVRVRVSAPTSGEVVLRTDLGFSIVQPVEVGPGRPDPVVPVLALGIDAPVEVHFRIGERVAARYRRRSLGRGLYVSDRLIGAAGTAPDAKTVLFESDPGRMRLEWLEGVDAVVGPAPAGFEAMGGIVAPDLAEALRRLDARGKLETKRFEPVDPELVRLAPTGRWIEARRRAALWFTLIYVAAGIVALAALARWRPRWWWAGALGMGAAGTALAVLAFPRGTVSVTRLACETDGARHEVYFLRRSRPGPAEVEFPCLVKPVYAAHQSATLDRFELRVSGETCRISKLTLEPGEVRIFSGVIVSGPSRLRAGRDGDRLTLAGKAYRAGVVDGERVADLGDIDGTAGAVPNPGEECADPSYRYFRRKLMREKAFGFGWASRKDVPGAGVRAADLAEEVEKPTLLLTAVR